MSTQIEGNIKKIAFLRENFKKLLSKVYKNNLSNKKPIVIASGGTGGHIVPAMKIVSDLISEGREVYFITDKRFKNYESLFRKRRFFSSPKLKIVITPIQSFSQSFSMLHFIKNCSITFFQVLWVYLKINPKIVIGFGGYVSFTPLLLALISFKCIILHEQNVIFGRVNKLFAKFAKSILLSFPDVSFIPKELYLKIRQRMVISGFPSFVISNGIQRGTSNKVIYDLTTKEEIVIVITGGGQGASFFTTCIPSAIVALAKSFPEKKFKIFHQVKKGEIEEALSLYENGKVSNIILEIKPLFENIPVILNRADIAILRGGAGSIIETALSKVFPIIIPMPNSADDHQIKNATVLANSNAGVMIKQEDCTPEKLAILLSRIINDGMFYFPIVNTTYEIFKNNPSQVFANVILYHDL